MEPRAKQVVAATVGVLLLAGCMHSAMGVTKNFCMASIGLSFTHLSTYRFGNWTGSGSLQSMSYDPSTKIVAVVEGLGSDDLSTPLALLALDYSDPSSPQFLYRVLFGTSFGHEEPGISKPLGVATWNGYAAVTLEPIPVTDASVLRIYHLQTGMKVGETVLTGCTMAENVHWLPDGKRIVTTCEGEGVEADDEEGGSNPTLEPNPEGGIAVVEVFVSGGSASDDTDEPPVDFYRLTSKLVLFQTYFDSISDSQYKSLLDRGLRIDPRNGGKDKAGRVIEPETIAFNEKYTKAWMTLQENNAIGLVSLEPGKEAVTGIWPLGWKNWGDYEVDVSDKDGVALHIHPNVYGWYMPDYVAFLKINGNSVLFTANEGDAKNENLRVKDLEGGLDPAAFEEDATSDMALGRLNVDPLFGMKGGYDASKAWNQQGPYEKLYAYGGRSWCIYDASSGKRLYESGSNMDTRTLAHPEASQCFDCDRTANAVDIRSDDMGSEPECVETFKLGEDSYVAVGTERQGAIFVYNVNNPRGPVFGDLLYGRDFLAGKDTPTLELGDLAPEAIKFVPANASGSGKPLLVVGYEVSGTVTVYEVEKIKECVID